MLPLPQSLAAFSGHGEASVSTEVQIESATGTNTNTPNALRYTYNGGLDTTGQVAPPGMKPRVTAILWEDEGTLCFQVEAKSICVARREGKLELVAACMVG